MSASAGVAPGRTVYGTCILLAWLLGSAACIWVVVHARYITDLSAFLPAKPTPLERLLVDQLREGPASRLVLVALEDGSQQSRAAVSRSMAQRLRRDAAFASVANGEALDADRDRNFLFDHRYLLSSDVGAGRFDAAGLHAAIEDSIVGLASSAGLLLKSLVPRDPTGELLHIIDRLAGTAAPRTADGVWVSGDGARTLLLAQTSAAGSDTDSQERDLADIRSAFDAAVAARRDAAAPESAVRLRLSGPGVFAVAARAKIKTAALRLSVVSAILVVCLLFAVYRSVIALGLGLLPVATGALAGVAAVALGFGAVHGITLGFGITLIGESVDYSIYFFIQSQRQDPSESATQAWRRTLWPTIRLGMLTSVCGFLSLLPSGFPGLAQLGLYSISGLIAAALVTRFVLPELLPRRFTIRDVAPLGRRLARLRDTLRRRGGRGIAATGLLLAAAALLVLFRHQHTLWNRELSALSPIAPEALRYDAALRADLGAANVLDLVVVEGRDLQAALRGAEHAQAALEPLLEAKVLGGIDSPTNYLPSLATQQARREALPDRQTLERNLQVAVAGLDLDAAQLAPFVDDVAAARDAALLGPKDLSGTSLAAAFDALVLHQADHWSALLPLHAVDAAAPAIDLARVDAVLSAAGVRGARVLDMKAQTDALYAGYLREAITLSCGGFLLIIAMLAVVLRSARRLARVIAPLVLAVLSVAAALVLAGQSLTILHLVGMLLIVAVGSNYALFFDAEAAPLTLASLAVANLTTVIGFGLLSLSQVPVLVALGTTVAPGALLALIYAALLTPNTPLVGRA